MKNRILNMKDTIVRDFKENTNTFNYAKEYGVYEVIDSFLYNTYEGEFNDEEVEQIIQILNKEFNL